MRSILEQFEPFAANRVFEIYTWVRQIRDKSKLTFNELITVGICDRRNGVQRSYCTAPILNRSCPLWVKSGHW
jgi:hypothetical protein